MRPELFDEARAAVRRRRAKTQNVPAARAQIRRELAALARTANAYQRRGNR